MTSLWMGFTRGRPRALGMLALSAIFFVATARAADPPKPAAAPPTTTTLAPAGAAAAPAAAAPTPPAAAGGAKTAGANPSGAPGAATGAPAAAAAPSTSGAPPAPADSAAAAPSAGGGDSGAYTVRLRSLEKNVNELKEQIFRTKARLNLLKETVLGGVIGASRAVIRHKNEMGSSFRLIRAAYALDGVQIYSKSDDSGRLAEMQEFDVYNGAIQPGSHTLSVVLQYQGNGFGVFSYLKGYKFLVKSSHSFVAGESKSTNITVVGYEKGNLTTQLSDKPAIDFRVSVVTSGENGSAAAAPAKK